MGNRFKKPFFNKDETAHHEWYERFLTTPDHELSVEDYIGPFPVGPLGYQRVIAWIMTFMTVMLY